MVSHQKRAETAVLFEHLHRSDLAKNAVKNGPHVQPWLPPAERVAGHLPHSEADDFVKDVFHSWIKKLCASISKDLSLRT